MAYQSEEKLVASPIPERGREIRTAKISGKSLGAMRNLVIKMFENPKRKYVTEKDVVDSFKEASPFDDEVYHEVYEPFKRYLVADSTLKEMERILNASMRPRTSFRFKNETSTDYPYNFTHLPEKLDEILEKMEEIEEMVLDDVEDDAEQTSIPESEVGDQPEVPPPTDDIVPVYQKITNCKKRKLHFQILGNYADSNRPKFKLVKYKQIFYNESDGDGGVYECGEDAGKKAHITMAAELYRTPSEGFMKAFNDDTHSEPVDSFTIKDSVQNCVNAANQCRFTINGKFLSEGENILPLISVNMNEIKAISKFGVERKTFYLNKPDEEGDLTEVKTDEGTTQTPNG